MSAKDKSLFQLSNEIEDLTQKVAILQDDLTHTRLILQALCRLLKDSTGITEDQLSETLADLETELENAPRKAECCPKCNRAIQKRSKACIYCGEPVRYRRLF